MKPTTFLLIVITIMHLTTLTNMTFFNNQWDGFVMAINTFLFIIAIALIVQLKGENKK